MANSTGAWGLDDYEQTKHTVDNDNDIERAFKPNPSPAEAHMNHSTAIPLGHASPPGTRRARFHGNASVAPEREATDNHRLKPAVDKNFLWAGLAWRR